MLLQTPSNSPTIISSSNVREASGGAQYWTGSCSKRAHSWGRICCSRDVSRDGKKARPRIGSSSNISFASTVAANLCSKNFAFCTVELPSFLRSRNISVIADCFLCSFLSSACSNSAFSRLKRDHSSCVRRRSHSSPRRMQAQHPPDRTSTLHRVFRRLQCPQGGIAKSPTTELHWRDCQTSVESSALDLTEYSRLYRAVSIGMGIFLLGKESFEQNFLIE